MSCVQFKKISDELVNALRKELQIDGPVVAIALLPDGRTVVGTAESEFNIPEEAVPPVKITNLTSAAFFSGEGSYWSCINISGYSRCTRWG